VNRGSESLIFKVRVQGSRARIKIAERLKHIQSGRGLPQSKAFGNCRARITILDSPFSMLPAPCSIRKTIRGRGRGR
jgi:hypothetical protein